MEEGKEVGDGRTVGSSVVGDGGQASISLMPDIDGIGSGSLLKPDAHFPPLKVCNLKVPR